MPVWKQQIPNSNKSDELVWQSSTSSWTITNSFSAAYLIWDRSENLATSELESELEFDYGEFSLEQFYNLVLETNLEFDTKIEQEATIGIEVNKNPFVLSGKGIGILELSQMDASFLPSPYINQDFISKKNYLGLFIEHEISLSSHLSLEFEGTFDVAISDTTDLRELPSVEAIEQNNFYPELSLNYELSDRFFIYTTVEYSVESVEGTDFNDRPLSSEIYRGIELGIETEFSNNWLATLSFYHETQENITTVDPNKPDFDLQIDQQSSNSWTGEIQGEITSGWWLYGFYTYTDATVTQDEVIKTVNKNSENSIRVRITGANQTPSAEVVPGRDNLVLSVTPQDTAAQEEPDEEIEIIATGEAEEGSDYFVPEAGVTRTNSPIIDTPGSVQVVPREVLEDQGINELRDALSRNAVGVTTNGSPRSNFQDVFIRGFEVDRRTLRNGIPDNIFALSPPRGLSNIEQLEVLSGAASIINGQVSPGGIINFVTKQPTDEPFYNLSLGYDSLNSIDTALDFSGPLNESKTVAYRLNASYYHSETFIDVDDADFDRFLIAPVVSWQIGDRTKLTFEGQYLDSRAVQVPFLPASGTVFDNPNGEIPPDQFLGEPDFDGNTRQIARIGYDLKHDFSDKWSLRHAFRYAHLQNDQIGALPLALQDDLRTLERGIFAGKNDIDNYQTTAYITGEFETGVVNHQLSAGIDYVFEEDILDFEQLTVGNIDIFEPEFTGELGEEVVETIDTRDTVDGLGLYVQDQLKIFDDRLILVLGGRVDFVGSTSKDLVDLSAEEESQDDSAFSPRVGLLYKLADNLSVFGSFSRSFEQETGTTAEAETFEPTRGTQFEIGAKANWLNDRLSTTLALYDLTQTNVTTEDPADPQFDIQTGEQKSQGIELQTKGEILPGWNIIANYAYTDTEVTEDNTIEVGNSFADVPENAANLWTTYTIADGSLSGLGFGFGLFYVGEREGDSDNSFQIDDYLRTDAAIYYRRNDLNLALNFQNIFDENYIEEVSNDLRVVYGDPFTVKFTTSYKF